MNATPYEQVRFFWIILSAIGGGLFISAMVGAVYILGSLFPV
jgi:hypothetical protein